MKERQFGVSTQAHSLHSLVTSAASGQKRKSRRKGGVGNNRLGDMTSEEPSSRRAPPQKKKPVCQRGTLGIWVPGMRGMRQEAPVRCEIFLPYWQQQFLQRVASAKIGCWMRRLEAELIHSGWTSTTSHPYGRYDRPRIQTVRISPPPSPAPDLKPGMAVSVSFLEFRWFLCSRDHHPSQPTFLVCVGLSLGSPLMR